LTPIDYRGKLPSVIHHREEDIVARASHKTFGLLTLALGTLLGGLITAPAVQADDSPTVCAHNCDFTTIQSAIDAASSGATIRVGAGIYTEKLTIVKSLSLIGLGQSGEHEATSSGPTIDGGPGTDSSPATITVNTNAIITPPPTINVTIRNFNIVHGGSGIDVLQNAVMTIDKNTISGYSKNGITFGPYRIDGFGGVSGTISNNIVTGSGPNSVVAQNGIQIGETNTANVVKNQVSGHVYTGSDWGATGIALLSDGSSISNNTVNANQVGIETEDANHNNVSDNTISNAISNGIYSWDSDGNTFSHNNIFGIRASTNNAWGIALDGGPDSYTPTIGSHNNTVSENSVQNSDVGIWVGNWSSSDTFTKNSLKGNSTNVQVDTYGGGAASTGLQFHNNSFTNSTLNNFTNSTTVTTDATNNWWGSAAGPGALVQGNVTTAPWCTNISCEKKSNKGDSGSSSHSGDKPTPEQKTSQPKHAGGVEK